MCLDWVEDMSHLLLLELGFFVKFVFIIVDFCVSILLPLPRLWRNPHKQTPASCCATIGVHASYLAALFCI